MTCVNMIFIKLINIVFNNLKTKNINMQSFLIYSLKYKNNSRNIDEEFLNLNYYNELNILTTKLKNERKLRLRKLILKKKSR